MCLLIVEVLLFLSGLWAMVSGELPSIVLGKQYAITGAGARIVGGLLALPLPTAFMAGLILPVILGSEQGLAVASMIELVMVIVSLIAARIISRRMRKSTLNVA